MREKTLSTEPGGDRATLGGPAARLSLAIAVTFVLMAAVVAMPASADTCSSFEIAEGSLSWISSLGYHAPSGDLLIVDPKERAMLRMDLETGKLDRAPVSNKRGILGFAPVAMTPVPCGYLVKLPGTDTVLLDDGLEPNLRGDYRMATKSRQNGIGALYPDWTAADGHFIGYGSMRSAGADASDPRDVSRGFRLGIIGGSLAGESCNIDRASLVLPLEPNDFYRLGYQYFASNDGGLFFVDMASRESAIHRVVFSRNGRASVERVASVPERFRAIEPLRQTRPGEDLFGEFEARTVPAGLIGVGSDLLLLTREPDNAGGTTWLVHRIRGGDDSASAVFRLPTESPHLTLQVAGDHLVAVERGPARVWGEQEIRQALVVPLSWLDDPKSSPIHVENVRVRSCSPRSASAN
jgi:hypothetical protein